MSNSNLTTLKSKLNKILLKQKQHWMPWKTISPLPKREFSILSLILTQISDGWTLQSSLSQDSQKSLTTPHHTLVEWKIFSTLSTSSWSRMTLGRLLTLRPNSSRCGLKIRLLKCRRKQKALSRMEDSILSTVDGVVQMRPSPPTMLSLTTSWLVNNGCTRHSTTTPRSVGKLMLWESLQDTLDLLKMSVSTWCTTPRSIWLKERRWERTGPELKFGDLMKRILVNEKISLVSQ